MTPANESPGRIYIWELPVRFSHWINALLLVGMFSTGLFIGWPLMVTTGEPYANATMAWVRYIHFLCGYLFVANWIFRIYWFFAGNIHAQNIFRFWEKRSWISIVKHGHDLAVAEPKLSQELPGHDQMARFWHSLFFLGCVFMIFTGYALYGESDSHSWSYVATRWGLWIFGTSRAMHYWHHLVSWFFPFFVIAHIYQVLRTDILAQRGLVSSMISGYYSNWTREDQERNQ